MYRFLIQSPIKEPLGQGRPALYAGKALRHPGNSVQISAQGNVLPRGIQLQEMENVVTAGVQGGLLPGKFIAGVISGHAAGFANRPDY